eukprot:CAMPEP_0114998910 /NCGR_PEP_ID=MMETSP0216-20121206/15809_1 /TAXON_ID=223996 /ORGANISM="Protocruzia adherens, Strain Boccale" /LENGTH=96 /DNA_ID=CAMNT_0002363639 /DNA_START=73 /DNA_END=363 /DNA_ORIENTATION=-
MRQITAKYFKPFNQKYEINIEKEKADLMKCWDQYGIDNEICEEYVKAADNEFERQLASIPKTRKKNPLYKDFIRSYVNVDRPGINEVQEKAKRHQK